MLLNKHLKGTFKALFFFLDDHLIKYYYLGVYRKTAILKFKPEPSKTTKMSFRGGGRGGRGGGGFRGRGGGGMDFFSLQMFMLFSAPEKVLQIMIKAKLPPLHKKTTLRSLCKIPIKSYFLSIFYFFLCKKYNFFSTIPSSTVCVMQTILKCLYLDYNTL